MSVQLSRRTLLGVGLAAFAAPACAGPLPDALTPAAFGASDSGDATSALNSLFTAAARAGRPADLSAQATYRVSRLVLPDGLQTTGAGAVFRGDDATGRNQTLVAVGRNVRMEALKIAISGQARAGFRIATVGQGCQIERFEVEADQQTDTVGVISAGQDVRIGSFRSRRIDRPLHIKVDAAKPERNFRLGRFEAEGYVRALRLDYIEQFEIGPLAVSGRSPNGSKHPGHNGILINGCHDGVFAPCRIANSGEHAIRIGGAQRNSARLHFQGVEAIQPGGCGFKINPNFQRFAAEDIQIDRLHSEDGGAPLSGNADVLRITHGRNIRVGELTARGNTRRASGWSGIKLNDVNGLTIDRADIQDTVKSLLLIDERSDGDPAGVYNVHIKSFRGSVRDARSFIGIEFVSPDYEIGNIRLDDVDFRGDAVNLIAVTGDATIRTNGPVSIQGRADGPLNIDGFAPGAPITVAVTRA